MNGSLWQLMPPTSFVVGTTLFPWDRHIYETLMKFGHGFHTTSRSCILRVRPRRSCDLHGSNTYRMYWLVFLEASCWQLTCKKWQSYSMEKARYFRWRRIPPRCAIDILAPRSQRRSFGAPVLWSRSKMFTCVVGPLSRTNYFRVVRAQFIRRAIFLSMPGSYLRSFSTTTVLSLDNT